MMPDKIYVPTEYTDNDITPVGVTTKQVFPRDVCYIRKDALIKWLEDMRFMANSERAGAYQNVIDKLNSL